jgi:two-component system chemotaxis response regulator CheY
MPICLIVDDSSVVRKVARRIVEKFGYEVAGAADGTDALDYVNSHPMPEAILLDWNMPQMQGIDFLESLRKMPNGKDPKVVFCTTENDLAKISRALWAGADEYIMKPFDEDILATKFATVGLRSAA